MGSVIVPVPVDVPSSEYVEPGSFSVPPATFPTAPTPSTAIPAEVVSQWLEKFNGCIAKKDFSAIPNLFLDESYWRDLLCTSWDFHTFKGPQRIKSELEKSKTGASIKSLAIDASSPYRAPKPGTLEGEHIIHIIQSFLNVETDIGRGSGHLKLVEADGTWKAYVLFTCLQELKGYEEPTRRRRPLGVEHGEHASPKNWLQRREDEKELRNGDPTVLILGAGQSGLSIAARLRMLGVPSLIVDREERIGDNWRKRYHHLVLHDPVWFDHLPYLPFPENWPVFTPKDKLGDWFESYVSLMELNVWTRTTIVKSEWDDATKSWEIGLERTTPTGVVKYTLHPKHVIQATGASGEPNFPDIKGVSNFKGTRLVHSSRFPGAVPAHGQNKKAIIIGCCNSGHDIAQDLYENGYQVTMVQRSTTFVIHTDTNVRHMDTYSEDGPPTEDADIEFQSFPNAVRKTANIITTKKQAKEDAKILDGLAKAGFKLDRGPNDSGIWLKYLQRGGGYYIDVGCSQLIADGKIKIKGCSIDEITEHGVKFVDGEELEADEIIFATGYLNITTQCRKIFGDKVADKVKDVWGFDEEGELRSIWRQSGHPGFWFMGGNLALCRFFSRLLALQIKATEEGLLQL
ncbi:hypothetical protein F5884DRAFT_845388 [Xylogone sp. PMI_703]|nr:hypothetical protein F5884DRAFT_845388 [Xylogone sp. PMI_703]